MSIDLKHIRTISRYTFYEIYKTQIFLTALFVGFLIFSLTVLATKLSYGSAQKVSLDISLGLISLSIEIISLIYGVGILSKEIENRTLHIILSRSVSRASFLLGKKIGLFLILTVNWAAVSVIGILSFIFFGGQMTSMVFLSLISIMITSGLILSLGTFLSLFAGRVICILVVLSVMFSSHFTPEILGSAYVQKGSLFETLLKVVDYAIPQFHRLNIKDIVLYEHMVEIYPISVSFFHSFTYIVFLSILSIMIFEKKDLK